MPNGSVYRCGCPNCTKGSEHPDKLFTPPTQPAAESHERAGASMVGGVGESLRQGHGGIRFMATVTGMALETIRRGRAELKADLEGRPADRIRVPGGGRPPVEKKIRPSKTT